MLYINSISLSLALSRSLALSLSLSLPLPLPPQRPAAVGFRNMWQIWAEGKNLSSFVFSPSSADLSRRKDSLTLSQHTHTHTPDAGKTAHPVWHCWHICVSRFVYAKAHMALLWGQRLPSVSMRGAWVLLQANRLAHCLSFWETAVRSVYLLFSLEYSDNTHTHTHTHTAPPPLDDFVSRVIGQRSL